MGKKICMQSCPRSHQTTPQNRAGETQSGSQRYKCKHFGSKYTPKPKQHGYPDEVRKQALQLYVDGMNMRRIGLISVSTIAPFRCG